MILYPDDPHQISFGCRADAVIDEPVVFALEQIVNSLDLSNLYGRYSEQGRSFYDPLMMLKVLFYSYSEGIRSSREIAKRIRYDIRYRYYTGQLCPDFRTINRFRLDNLDLLGDYFAQIVSYAEESGYLDVSVVAIDGTKIRASASGQRAVKQRNMDELASRYQEELRRDAVCEEPDADKPCGDDANVNSDDGEGVTTEVRRSSSGVSDPDARFMKTSEGGKRLSYNSHIAVDNGQFIVAAEVSNCADDSVQLESMIERCRENVDGELGSVLADGGYYSGNNIKQAAQSGVDLYMPVSATGRVPDQRYHRDAFIYDAESNSYLCPEGERLRYRYSRRHRNVQKKIYSGCALSCGCCSHKALCTTGRYRRLEISENYWHERQMKTKLASNHGRAIYGRRMSLVEAVFGNLKFNLGFGRYRLRGLKKVRGEFLLMCIAHNLKKLAKYDSLLGPLQTATQKAIRTAFSLLSRFFRHHLGILGYNLGRSYDPNRTNRQYVHV